MPTTFSTGYINGTVTGTFVAFPYSTLCDVYLRPHPDNKSAVYIISNPGSIGYPLPSGSAPLFLDDVEDLSTLSGWFNAAGDKICYLILTK
jgi:hypothetical protein